MSKPEPKPAVGIALLVAASAAVGAFAAGYHGTRILERELSDTLRAGAAAHAALLATQLDSELRSEFAIAKLLLKSPGARVEELGPDDGILAARLFKQAHTGEWSILASALRPESDPDRLNNSELETLDNKYPLDMTENESLPAQLWVGEIADGKRVFRMGKAIHAGFLVVEMKHERLVSTFAKNPRLFSFLIDPKGKLIAESEPSHFSYSEDLLHLPVVKTAFSSPELQGSTDYSEVPGGSLRLAGYHKATVGRLLVVSEASEAGIHALVLATAAAMGAIGALVALLAGLLAYRLAERTQPARVPAKTADSPVAADPLPEASLWQPSEADPLEDAVFFEGEPPELPHVEEPPAPAENETGPQAPATVVEIQSAEERSYPWGDPVDEAA